MRRLITGLVVAAVAAILPTVSLAGNQEVAEQIGASLRNSGQLQGRKVAVKYQDGVAWLKGSIASEAQKKALMDAAMNTPGVTRVVASGLVVAGESQAVQASASEPIMTPAATQSLDTPLQTASGALSAEQTPRSFSDVRAPAAPRVAAPTVVEQPAVVEKPVVEQPMAAPVTEVVREAPGPQLSQPVRPIALQEPAVAAPAPAPEAAAAQPARPAVAPAPVQGMVQGGGPLPMGAAAARYDRPNMPAYAWPGYAAYPNYAAVTYPKQYAPTAWPYVGPFYPYPQVPLGWRKVTLEWHDGYWNLDFDDGRSHGYFSGLFRPHKR